MQEILTEFSDICDVETLGLGLGLRLSALEKIMTEHPQQLEKQKICVFSHWLKRRDIVRKKQNELPTWTGLADAVTRLDPKLSERIQCLYCQKSRS